MLSFHQRLASVVQVLNGTAPLSDDDCRPVFVRIGRRVAKWMEDGMQPPLRYGDPFEWRPRSFNVRADAVCNLVLDTDADVNITAEDLECILSFRPQLLVYTDGPSAYGGCRGHGTTAIGWVIYAFVNDGKQWRHIDLAIQGRKLEGNFNSLVAETQAIDAAVDILDNIIDRMKSL